MKSPPYRRLLRVLTGSSPSELYQQIQFLKAENEVLRARVQGPVRRPGNNLGPLNPITTSHSANPQLYRSNL